MARSLHNQLPLTLIALALLAGSAISGYATRVFSADYGILEAECKENADPCETGKCSVEVIKVSGVKKCFSRGCEDSSMTPSVKYCEGKGVTNKKCWHAGQDAVSCGNGAKCRTKECALTAGGSCGTTVPGTDNQPCRCDGLSGTTFTSTYKVNSCSTEG